jgi:hypothetical protein
MQFKLQALRGLLKPVDEADYAAFAEQAYALLGTALELSVKDLRSQVCREACITVALVSTIFQGPFHS